MPQKASPHSAIDVGIHFLLTQMPYICSNAIIGPRLSPVAIPANMIDVPCENQVIDM